MAIKKFSELNTETTIPSGAKLVAVTGTGQFGRNLNVSPWELRVPGLPAGYTPCQYVEATTRGTYIDTGVAGGADFGFQLAYQYTGAIQPSNASVIIGAGTTDGDKRQWASNATTGALNVGWGDTLPQGTDTTNNVVWGQVNFLKSGTGTCKVAGVDAPTLTLPSATLPTSTIYLFANHGTSGAELFTIAKLFRCRISVGKVVVRDFYPIRRDSDSKYGLFDTVEGKAYFPEVGTLTGSVCGSTWDYSYLDSQTGGSGAYIDEYPTPDSASFVEASGVEKGMKQIREALMVGPMMPTITGGSATAQLNKPFLDLLQNWHVENSAFGYMPNYTPCYGGGGDNLVYLNNSTNIISRSISSRSRLAVYGDGTNNGDSYYLTFNSLTGTAYSGYANSNSCAVNAEALYSNYVITSLSGCASLQGSTTPVYSHTQDAYGITARLIEPAATLIGVATLSSGGTQGTNIKNSSISVYAPMASSQGFCFYNEPTKISGNTNRVKVYAPRAATINNANSFAMAFNPRDLAYFLTYYPKDGTKAVKQQLGIDQAFFTITTTGEAPTGTVETDYKTTCGTSTDRSVVVEKTETDGTNTLTTIYTLDNSDDSNAFRDALWNTNGYDGTSTGLLDGVVQVGDNKGTAYEHNVTLDLRPTVNE